MRRDGWQSEARPGAGPTVPGSAVKAESSRIVLDAVPAATAERSRRVLDYLTTEWTDEKHSLHLNSIEASFIHQLFRHEYCSKDLLSWPPIAQKLVMPSTSNAMKLCSVQTKILHKGRWETREFKWYRTRVDIENETRLLYANPWIQHFTSPFLRKKLHQMSSDQVERNDTPGKAMPLRSQRHGGESTTSNKLQACCSRIYCKDAVGSRTEVSDQNFVGKNSEGRDRFGGSGSHKRKREKTFSC